MTLADENASAFQHGLLTDCKVCATSQRPCPHTHIHSSSLSLTVLCNTAEVEDYVMSTKGEKCYINEAKRITNLNIKEAHIYSHVGVSGVILV